MLAKRIIPCLDVTGGRVVNYLKRFIGDPRSDIVFVGYQASGTPGRLISRGSDWVRLNGRKYQIAADVHRIHGYSAHADQHDLIEFVKGFQQAPKSIRLVHGEYRPKKVLSAKLVELGYDVI